jgi:hypothetical protein
MMSTIRNADSPVPLNFAIVQILRWLRKKVSLKTPQYISANPKLSNQTVIGPIQKSQKYSPNPIPKFRSLRFTLPITKFCARFTKSSPMDVDSLISPFSTAEQPTLTDIDSIISLATPVFSSEPNTLQISPPITICGDSHGQLFDVLQLFYLCKTPPSCRYLFLGDYVDRGYYSVELICLLICYKIKYPNDIFLLRGNHETRNANREYGLYAEIQTKYHSLEIYHKLNNLFDLFPFTAVVDDRLFCVHVG